MPYLKPLHSLLPINPLINKTQLSFGYKHLLLSLNKQNNLQEQYRLYRLPIIDLALLDKNLLLNLGTFASNGRKRSLSVFCVFFFLPATSALKANQKRHPFLSKCDVPVKIAQAYGIIFFPLIAFGSSGF